MTLSPQPDLTHSSNPIRRTSRACLQCRTRKQRCYSDSDSPIISGPCQRCRSSGKVCSFENEDVVDQGRFRALGLNSELSNVNSMAKIIASLQSELVDNRARLEALEQAVNIPIGSPMISSSPIPMKKRFSMDGVALSAPIATLRTLSSFSEDEGDSFMGKGTGMSLSDSLSPLTRQSPGPSGCAIGGGSLSSKGQNLSSAFDPVTRGILSIEEGQALFDIFFAHCHSLAPVLCTRTQNNASNVRHSSPILFTTVCSVGARFWGPQISLHPCYTNIIRVLDQAIGQLLLRPTPSDMKVEAVQALLIYVQWMPIDVYPMTTAGPSSPSSPQSFTESPASLGGSCYTTISARSRFSDTSAWSLVGFAIRLANLLGLDRSVDAPFSSPEVSDEALIRMRVWMNLLSIDHHLTLTARLPASLDPVPAARVARLFASSPQAEPTDLKVAGLCELVAVVHRAAKCGGDSSLRVLDRVSLQKANAELNDWESIWAMVLSRSGYHHYSTQMPFTALRWTRLALNVVSLGPEFLGNNHIDEFRTPCASALRNAVDAAASMLYCFSSKDQDSSSQMGPLILDTGALSCFKYSIDAYWITHAFAVVFLAMAYERGVINDDLSLTSSSPLMATQIPTHLQDGLSYPSQESPLSFSYPSSRALPSQESSTLHRLVRLAADVFANAAIQPPAAHYRQIVDNTLNALTLRGGNGQCMLESGLGVADMFALVMEEGFDGSIFDSESVFGGFTGMSQ